MKNFWLTLVIAAAVCGAAFAIGYKSGGDPELSRAASEGDAMAWLRAEFKLNDAQFAAVKKTHEDYSVVCGEHCAAIMAAKSRGAPAGDVEALEKICVAAMTAHFKNVAGLMSAGQGRRYLATVLPRVAGYDHRGAPDARMTP